MDGTLEVAELGSDTNWQSAIAGSTGKEHAFSLPAASDVVEYALRIAREESRFQVHVVEVEAGWPTRTFYVAAMQGSVAITDMSEYAATARLEKALAYLRNTPHRRAGRDAATRKRMKMAVRLIEELEAVSPTAAPSDLSTNLDKYLYGTD